MSPTKVAGSPGRQVATPTIPGTQHFQISPLLLGPSRRDEAHDLAATPPELLSVRGVSAVRGCDHPVQPPWYTFRNRNTPPPALRSRF